MANLLQDLNDFTKDFLRSYLNENGMLEAYIHYRDEINYDFLYEAIEEKSKHPNDKFISILSDKYFEKDDADWASYEEDELIKQFEIALAYNEELNNYYIEHQDNVWDLFYRNGYNGVELPIKQLLSQSDLRVNLHLATPEEQNYDLCSIKSCFNWNYRLVDDNPERYDNCLTYLIHQQGYKVEDVWKDFGEEKGGYSNPKGFIQSVTNEIANQTDNGAANIVALVRFTGDSLCDFLDTVYGNDEKYITLDKSTMLGSFDLWNGGGSLLEIQLDKDFEFPKDFLYDMQFEGGYKRSGERSVFHRGYSVNEVYGLVGNCWDDTYKGCTEEKPELVCEDMDKTIDYIMSITEPQEELEI